MNGEKSQQRPYYNLFFVMLGKLNASQCETVLRSQLIGRIGCHADNLTYVVPVTYVYDEGYLYAHSAAGMKIDIMRKNASVCFETDDMQNMANWQSVIAWGEFEEIKIERDKKMAMQKLIDRVMPLMTSETAQPSHGMSAHLQDAGHQQAILFRIKILKLTGRFEKR
jgi:uncharacterized protein